MNPIAIDSVSTAFSALASVLHEATRDFMTLEPELLWLRAVERRAAPGGADRRR